MRVLARGGSGGGLGYRFRTQRHVCFCEGNPCPHGAFTGEPSLHRVLPCTQQKAEREQATHFVDTIKVGTPLASKGNLDDSTAGNEPLWCASRSTQPRIISAPVAPPGPNLGLWLRARLGLEVCLTFRDLTCCVHTQALNRQEQACDQRAIVFCCGRLGPERYTHDRQWAKVARVVHTHAWRLLVVAPLA